MVFVHTRVAFVPHLISARIRMCFARPKDDLQDSMFGMSVSLAPAPFASMFGPTLTREPRFRQGSKIGKSPSSRFDRFRSWLMI